MKPDLPLWVSVHERWHRTALWIGVAALAACAIGYHYDPKHTVAGYLVSWLFLLSLSLGSLASLMMYHLTAGAWGIPVRRYFEAASMQVPLLALLFVPLAFGTSELYNWASPAAHLDADLVAKRWYLNEPFFFGRAACYLVLWGILAVLLERGTRRQRRLPGLSAVGLLLYGVAMTFAAVDWVGSLIPRWSSTALGLIVIVGQGLGAFAFATACTTAMQLALQRQAPAPQPQARDAPTTLTSDRANDLGNLLLAFTMTWMYLVFSQFLIIWAEDIPRETIWYLPRSQGLWRDAGIALVVGQFAAPFGLLLFRRLKRNPRTLLLISLLALTAHWLDVTWLVLPSLPGNAFTPSDLVATVGVGGVWLYGFGCNLAARPSFAHAGFDIEPASTKALRHG